VLLLARDVHRHVLGRPDLAVRVRVARTHRGAAVLEDLDVADARVGAELLDLLRPDLDDPLDGLLRQRAEVEVVPRRVADDAAGAVLARALGDERRKVVREHEGAVVVRVPDAARARVPGAEVAGPIVLRQLLARRRLDLPLPRAAAPLRRDEHPLARERVPPPVRR
jgi:hypothetical protein